MLAYNNYPLTHTPGVPNSSLILSRILHRGYLIAGVSHGIVGLSWCDQDGEWFGFDVDIARGLAAIVLEDPNAVQFRPTSPEERFESIRNGEIDVGTFNASCTLTRELSDVTFPVIALYDGEAAIVRKAANIRCLKDFPAPRIAMQGGTLTPHNLALYFGDRPYHLVPADTLEEAFLLYDKKHADAVVFDAIGLAAMRSILEKEEDHEILPERFSKEAMGPVTLGSDLIWTRLVAWTIRSLILAEELSLTSGTVRQEARSPSSLPIAFFLQTGLPLFQGDGAAQERLIRLLEAVGNYKELFNRNLGLDSNLQLDRNLNRLWMDGGLLYSPPTG